MTPMAFCENLPKHARWWVSPLTSKNRKWAFLPPQPETKGPGPGGRVWHLEGMRVGSEPAAPEET